MPRFETPIRDYLSAEFNQVVNERGEDPFEAYVRLENHLARRALFYDTYAQATITSGGHARNPNLSWIEIVKKNITFAQAMAVELYESGQLNPKQTIEASTLGLIDHWKESDYITFWLNTLGRPDLIGYGSASKVKGFRANLHHQLTKEDIDYATFNDYRITPKERAPYYFKLADAFVAALKLAEYQPVDRLVAVSETSNSLGANTERYFAKKLGTKVFGLAIAQLGESQLPSDFGNPYLIEDSKQIVEYGGQIFDPAQKSQIVIVKQ